MSGARAPQQAVGQIARLYREQRHGELEACARRWLQSHPQDGNLWKALGVACTALGKRDEAVEAKRRAVELLPRDPEAHVNLANALAQLRAWPDAEREFRAALELDPKAELAWRGLAQALAAMGRVADAAACHERICGLQPDSAPAFVAWGCALRQANDGPGSQRAFERAVQLAPRDAEALMNLAISFAQQGRAERAEALLRDALQANPRAAAIHSNLGNLLRSLSRHEEALAHLRTALELQPDLPEARSNLLITLASAPGVTAPQVKAEAQAYGRWVSARMSAPAQSPRARAQGPVRVGFVSGDLREHPVACFLESFLAHWPSARAQLVAYATVPAQDAVTQRLMPAFAAWRPIFHIDDAQAAALVAQDGIDVLVDLSGHTAYNRLPMFALRPAPVQATWLGYFATTGVEQMDWIISDEASTPPGSEADFTERVWRLPATRHCFTPPRDAPAVAPLPAAANGFVTFGSFQNLRKIHPGVLDAWSAVLRAVPGSRLRLQNAQFGDARAQDELLQAAEARGVPRERIALHGRSSREGYWRAHQEVDIILDTFPYPGATTTCEGLWMGVPTVTLTGTSFLERLGHAMLAAAGMPQLVAATPQAYVDIAVALAGDTRKLAALREGMRAHLAAQPLFDAPRFARDLADAFAAMARA